MQKIDNGPVILFDGLCNLCNSSVQFVLKRDKEAQFHFASLQSAYAKELLQKFNLSSADLNSFILYKEGRIYTRSTGALMVAKQLSGAWPLLSAFLMVPAIIRNGVYNLIARNRYKWFGKKNECWIPTPELKSRFFN